MSLTCTVCSHPERSELERRLVQGASQRAMATQFRLGRSAIRRHIAGGHVPVAIVVAEHEEREAHAIDLTSRVEQLWRRASSILEREAGRPNIELQAIRELRACVELLAKLSGAIELAERGAVSIQLSFSNGAPLDSSPFVREQLLRRETERDP